jgi:mRNA interferase RelE/StbE
MQYEVFYTEAVVKTDIPKINKRDQSNIRKAIEKKLALHPEIYGKPLRTSLSGFRKLRIGSYRVIFEIMKKKVIIYAIGHRKEIYEMAKKRLGSK